MDSLTKTLTAFALRIVIVAAVHFVTFELVMQLSVEWRESTGELAFLAQVLLLIMGIIWCYLPVFSHFRSRAWIAVVTAVCMLLSFAGFHTVTNYYSWHIRPNIGLYEEARWVSKHPTFQRQLRAKIENSLWKEDP